jgi:phage gpG-like protein
MESRVTTPRTDPSDLSDLFAEAQFIMFQSVMENFSSGGRPNTWAPLKKTGAPSHLYKSGRLIEQIRSHSGSDFAEVYVSDVPYAAIQNFGGTIHHPGSTKFQAFQIGDKWVYTHGTQPHEIDIPARPFMLFQDEDVVRVQTLFAQDIIGMFFTEILKFQQPEVA